MEYRHSNIEEIIKSYGEFKDLRNKTVCSDCNWNGVIDKLMR